MSNCNRFCLAEAHKPCQVLPNSVAHGPTTLPSTLSVATVASSVIETLITGFFFLHSDRANKSPKSQGCLEPRHPQKLKDLWVGWIFLKIGRDERGDDMS